MEVGILILPPKATIKVFKLLGISTLLRMRTLDKATKEIIDNLLTINQTQLDHFHIFEIIDEDEITTMFFFKSIRDLLFGKIFAISASAKFPDMKWSLTCNKQGIRITLRSAYFKTFLVHYCCLLPAGIIAFCNLSADIIHTCSIHFDGALYGCCQIPPNLTNTDFGQWADLVHLIRPKYVSVSALPRTQASLDFLLELADVVSKLNIVLERVNSATDPVLIRLVHEILNRKCETVLIDHSETMETTLSVSDVEKLIQFVHHTGKQKSVIMWMPLKKRKIDFGEFRLERHRRRGGRSEFKLIHLS